MPSQTQPDAKAPSEAVVKDVENICGVAWAWAKAGKGVAIATVVETWGSAPRRVGSQLVISSEAEIEGSVSGGCVEGAVVAEALEAIEAGEAKMLTYGVSDDDAFAVGLACGGTIRILVEPLGAVYPMPILEERIAARKERRPIAVVSDLKTGKREAVALGGAYDAFFSSDKSGFEEDLFVAVQNPPLRLIVVGAVHIAQALLPMARLAGYDPVLVDPRPAFGAEHRFEGEQISDAWPDAALEEIGIDLRTSVVTLTHDPKLDDPALQIALKSEAFYVGALGSTRTHAKRVQRLSDAGLSEENLGRLHAPVGLDIGAASPAEIAVSILAEMTARLRGK
ncbi:MAG: XdhC family protein [Pseudomonadota bacterium]